MAIAYSPQNSFSEFIYARVFLLSNAYKFVAAVNVFSTGALFSIKNFWVREMLFLQILQLVIFNKAYKMVAEH